MRRLFLRLTYSERENHRFDSILSRSNRQIENSNTRSTTLSF